MNKPRRAPRRQVDGVLLLDKPAGMSSNAALQAARRLFNAEKAGHTGTLDPLATGLLPLCFGEATKFAGELLDADKTYRAALRLGITTATADAEGHVLETRPVAATREQLEAVLTRYTGEIEQVPPMHSALKRDGKPLYEYARAGIELERAPRRVTIHELRLLSLAAELVEIEVTCSKGTYVRTLAADIGTALGCGAHLVALRRTCIGMLNVAAAVSLATLEAMDMARRDACLAAADSLLGRLPAATFAEGETARILQGQAVRWSGAPGERLRLYGADGRFIGLGILAPDGWLQPKRLIAAGEKTAANS